MTIPRFYIENNNYKINDIVNLPIDIVHHIRVLRLKKGDIINLFNNTFTATATIHELNKYDSKVIINVINATFQKNKIAINLAVSLLSNDKMDLIIQKVTELDVSSVTPIIFERTQKIDINKISKKYEHWKKIIISACEQSGRNDLMTINAIKSFKNYIKELDYDLKIICNLNLQSNNILTYQKDIHNILLMVGPEGGFTNEEIENAKDSKFISLKVAENTLRSETAAIIAVSTLNNFYNNIIQFKY